MRPPMPTHARWAAGLIAFSGVLLTGAGLLTLSLDRVPASGRATGFVGATLIGGALVLVAWQMRRRQRWAHRTAVVLVTLQLVIGIVMLLIDARAAVPWFAALLLWLLLHPKTRRWFDGVPEPTPDRPLDEPSLHEINRRFAERPITRD
ncbi:MAG TPA: hypothetical protein VFU93_01510 [Acidimicrobiales bacterium]|nr:hypothetical protein [Acidimicrobiales bacterium]